MRTKDCMKRFFMFVLQPKESIYRQNSRFDFMGKFGFDLSSTADFVYSTLSKKYSTDFVYSTLSKKYDNDTLQQKVVSNLLDYYNAGSIFKNDFLILSSDNTLEDFFNANSVAITFDESQKIEEIFLTYDRNGGKQMRRHLHAVRELRKMCNSAKSFNPYPSEPLESGGASILDFSNCVVIEIHSGKYNNFIINFSKKEE